METIRAFIALNIPTQTLNRIAEIQKVLRKAAKKARVRVGWVPAANMHVTLKFLGEIDAVLSGAQNSGLHLVEVTPGIYPVEDL